MNFVRGCEPRKQNWDLYTPVEQEQAVNRAHGLPATFLLQYDALIRPDFQELFLRERDETMELGLWLEMNRPLTEAVGIASSSNMNIFMERTVALDRDMLKVVAAGVAGAVGGYVSGGEYGAAVGSITAAANAGLSL